MYQRFGFNESGHALDPALGIWGQEITGNNIQPDLLATFPSGFDSQNQPAENSNHGNVGGYSHIRSGRAELPIAPDLYPWQEDGISDIHSQLPLLPVAPQAPVVFDQAYMLGTDGDMSYAPIERSAFGAPTDLADGSRYGTMDTRGWAG